MKRGILCSVVWAILLFGLAVQAGPLKVGEPIPIISAKDQHGKSYSVTNGTAFLLIALDMDGAKAANKALATQGKGFLEKHQAAYLMDIHTMPGIGRYFALRKMRKYPQRIVLIESAGTMNWVPFKPKHITVLALDPERRIRNIRYWQPASEPVTNVFSNETSEP